MVILQKIFSAPVGAELLHGITAQHVPTSSSLEIIFTIGAGF
jgi:hypothetical protein